MLLLVSGKSGGNLTQTTCCHPQVLSMFDSDLDFKKNRVRLWRPGTVAELAGSEGLEEVPAAVLNESGGAAGCLICGHVATSCLICGHVATSCLICGHEATSCLNSSSIGLGNILCMIPGCGTWYVSCQLCNIFCFTSEQ